MKLIAITTDGMKNSYSVEVTKLSYWKNHNPKQTVNRTNLFEFLNRVQEKEKLGMNHRMGIYKDCPVQEFNGHLSHSDETLLYTNGQLEVVRLELNGNTIWEKTKIQKS